MNYFDGVKVVVTGGAGFIGSHIVDRLMSSGAQVCVLDDMSNGSHSNLRKWQGKPKFELINGDIRNREVVRQSVTDAEYVFHQAAKVSVPLSVKDPILVMDVNVMGTTLLLDECRRADVSKVVVASSSSVYGDTPTLPKVESMTANPISPYGVSKLAEERITTAFHATYGLHTTALRYFNVYGPRQRGGSYAGVISIFILKALENAPLPIEGDGQQTRDFTYIQDIVDCNLLAAVSPRSNGKVYNVGGGSRVTIETLADRIIEITQSKSDKEYKPPREGDVRDSLAGLDEASRDLGYSPEVQIDKGLRNTIRWVQLGTA